MAHCINQPPKKAKAMSKGRRAKQKKNLKGPRVTESFVTRPSMKNRKKPSALKKKRRGPMRSY